jgi:hypothetical protein
MALLFALLYKPYSPQAKTGRYRPTGIIIPAGIYHVEVTAEVVPLCV